MRAPRDYWGWTGDELIPLGTCEDFDKADARLKRNVVWIFSREMLEQLRDQINEELKS